VTHMVSNHVNGNGTGHSLLMLYRMSLLLLCFYSSGIQYDLLFQLLYQVPVNFPITSTGPVYDFPKKCTRGINLQNVNCLKNIKRRFIHKCNLIFHTMLHSQC